MSAICQSCGQLVNVASYLPNVKVIGLRMTVSLLPICAAHDRSTQAWENLPASVQCFGSGTPGLDESEGINGKQL